MFVPLEERMEYGKRNMWKIEIVLQHNGVFSRQNYLIANIFFIKVCEIKNALYYWLICLNDVVRTMTSSMLQKFDKYWSGCHIVMAIATIFDPRYKMKILEF